MPRGGHHASEGHRGQFPLLMAQHACVSEAMTTTGLAVVDVERTPWSHTRPAASCRLWASLADGPAWRCLCAWSGSRKSSAI